MAARHGVLKPDVVAGQRGGLLDGASTPSATCGSRVRIAGVPPRGGRSRCDPVLLPEASGQAVRERIPVPRESEAVYARCVLIGGRGVRGGDQNQKKLNYYNKYY